MRNFLSIIAAILDVIWIFQNSPDVHTNFVNYLDWSFSAPFSQSSSQNVIQFFWQVAVTHTEQREESTTMSQKQKKSTEPSPKSKKSSLQHPHVYGVIQFLNFWFYQKANGNRNRISLSNIYDPIVQTEQRIGKFQWKIPIRNQQTFNFELERNFLHHRIRQENQRAVELISGKPHSRPHLMNLVWNSIDW